VSPKFVLVEATTRQIQGDLPQQPDTAYQRWVLAAIEQEKLAEIIGQRDEAFAIGEWLDGRPYDLDLLEAASSDLIETVFRHNPEAVQAALRRQVGQRLPPALIDRAAGQIYRQSSQTVLYRYLRQGFDRPWLLERLYESYAAQGFDRPSRSELKALTAVLEQSEHRLLGLLVTHWTESGKQLARALRRLDEETYRQFGQVALQHRLTKPLNLLVPGHGNNFLDLYLSDVCEDLAELTEALIQVEETACLARLSDKLAPLSHKELAKIAKLIEDRADVPAAFREAVVEARAALPPQRSLKGMLKAILPGQSGKR
jgi:hypothetical protein